MGIAIHAQADVFPVPIPQTTAFNVLNWDINFKQIFIFRQQQ